MKCPNKSCPYNDDECQHIADFKDYKMCDLYRESIKPPKTNADLIRAMSDEDIALEIEWFMNEVEVGKTWNHKDIVDWLKQEVE